MLVLRCCPPHRAAKTFRLMSDGRWIKLSDYDAGMWFSVLELDPRSLDDIADLVTVLRRKPARYVVRGCLIATGVRSCPMASASAAATPKTACQISPGRLPPAVVHGERGQLRHSVWHDAWIRWP